MMLDWAEMITEAQTAIDTIKCPGCKATTYALRIPILPAVLRSGYLRKPCSDICYLIGLRDLVIVMGRVIPSAEN